MKTAHIIFALICLMGLSGQAAPLSLSLNLGGRLGSLDIAPSWSGWGSAHDPFSMGGGGITIGNGGQTVVCLNSEGTIGSMQVLDLYEGKVLNGYSYQKPAQNMDAFEMALVYARKIDAAYGNFNEPLVPREKTIEGRLQYVVENMRMLPPGVGLDFTKDTYEFFKIPKNCSLEQTINFRDSRKIYVNVDIWNLLTVQDKAALLLHEAVYWYLRDTGDELEHDSRRARRVVAYLFSGQELPSRTALQVPGLKKVQYCRSYRKTAASDDFATRMLVYRNPQGKVVVQFLQIGGYRVLTQSFLIGDVIDTGATKSSDDLGVDDLPIKYHQLGISGIKGQLQSPLDIDGNIRIIWGKEAEDKSGGIRLSGELQPGNKLADFLQCSVINL